jgi:hypothetical protein
MASENAARDLLRVPCFNIEVREKSYFFSLPNSTARYHTGKAAASFNADTQEFRVARWALEKNAELWGIRIEEDNTVSVIYPDDSDLFTPSLRDPNAAELVDKIMQDLRTLRKLLS